jgi:hypothetical protein
MDGGLDPHGLSSFSTLLKDNRKDPECTIRTVMGKAKMGQWATLRQFDIGLLAVWPVTRNG